MRNQKTTAIFIFILLNITALGELIQFQGKLLSKLFLLPSEKGSVLKGKNLLLKGLVLQVCKQEVTEVVSHGKNGRKSTKCIQSPKLTLVLLNKLRCHAYF